MKLKQKYVWVLVFYLDQNLYDLTSSFFLRQSFYPDIGGGGHNVPADVESHQI